MAESTYTAASVSPLSVAGMSQIKDCPGRKGSTTGGSGGGVAGSPALCEELREFPEQPKLATIASARNVLDEFFMGASSLLRARTPPHSEGLPSFRQSRSRRRTCTPVRRGAHRHTTK